VVPRQEGPARLPGGLRPLALRKTGNHTVFR
jgi:hypothetical protein